MLHAVLARSADPAGAAYVPTAPQTCSPSDAESRRSSGAPHDHAARTSAASGRTCAARRGVAVPSAIFWPEAAGSRYQCSRDESRSNSTELCHLTSMPRLGGAYLAGTVPVTVRRKWLFEPAPRPLS